MKKRYAMLPHYSFDGKSVIFLGKVPLIVSAKELSVLHDISAGEFINQDSTTRRLSSEMIIIEAEDVIREGKTEIFVVAHSDDAALSLGGYALTSRNRIRILNVFSNCPITHTLDNYLKTQEEVTFFNNNEEEFYSKMINAELVFLNYPEALQRGYKNPFIGKFSDIELEVIERIRQDINRHIASDAQLYFPLGIGNHIDHVMLSNIGKDFLSKGIKVTFYEDLPYTKEISPSDLEKQMNEKTENLGIIKEVDISDVIQRKILLASTYKTQYSPSYLSILADYAIEIGKDKLIERMWGRK